MEDLIPILNSHPFLNGLEPRYVAELATYASTAEFATGKFVFRQNQEAGKCYLIRKGKVILEILNPARGSIVIDTLDQHDVLGWSWLLPPFRWKFDAIAIEPVEAIVLDGPGVREECEKNHDLGFELVKRFLPVIEHRLQSTRLHLLDIYGTPTTHRH